MIICHLDDDIIPLKGTYQLVAIRSVFSSKVRFTLNTLVQTYLINTMGIVTLTTSHLSCIELGLC